MSCLTIQRYSQQAQLPCKGASGSFEASPVARVRSTRRGSRGRDEDCDCEAVVGAEEPPHRTSTLAHRASGPHRGYSPVSELTVSRLTLVNSAVQCMRVLL